MNFPGFYTPSFAWLFFLMAPLILFYFLKLKRPRLAVSSLAIWRQVLNDNRVNSPFQKFKRNLLLLLQLLILAAVVLAAMQPYVRGSAARITRLPILIDCSASMAALDKPGGITRLEAAKQRTAQVIDGLLSDQELCLVSFGRTAHKMTGFTSNKRVLREALSQIAVEDMPSDVEDALRMAQALARTEPFDQVLLLSDGNFPERANVELSFKLDYQRLPPAGPNFGITALNAGHTEDGWDVFLQVEGSKDASGTVTARLIDGSEEIGRETIAVANGKAERVLFQIKSDKAESLRVELTPDGFDSLASDNVAYLDVPASRRLWIYVPPEMTTWRHAASALKGANVFPEGKELDAVRRSATFDLLVCNNQESLPVEARTRLFVGQVPPDLQKLVAVDDKGTEVVDWRHSAPLLQHVELSDLVILDRPVSATGAQDNDYENLGYEIIAHGSSGPLLLEKRESDRLSYYLLFDTDRSTLPYRVGFMVMMSNLAEVARKQAGIADAQGNRTGVLPAVTLRPDSTYQVELPNGEKREEKSDVTGQLSGVAAPRIGTYRFLDGGTERLRVGASLLSPRETSLASVEAIEFNEQLRVAAAAAPLRTERSFWKYCALAAFLILLVEWWYFHRRPGRRVEQGQST
jgi:hypothetical protein